MKKHLGRVPKVKKLRRVGYGLFSWPLWRMPVRLGVHRRRRALFRSGVLLPFLLGLLAGRRKRKY